MFLATNKVLYQKIDKVHPGNSSYKDLREVFNESFSIQELVWEN